MICLLGIILILVIIFMESNRDLTELIYAMLLLIVLIVGTMISNQNNEGFVNFPNYAPIKYVGGACDQKVVKQGEGLGMPRMYDMQASRMSSLDGDKLFQPDSEPNRADKWRHSPSNLPLIKSPFLTSPVGEDIPIGDDLVSAYYPKVDEDKDAPRRMFMFTNNQCRPECCPATFSCDGGCVCTTETQRKMIAGRGGNSTPGNEY